MDKDLAISRASALGTWTVRSSQLVRVQHNINVHAAVSSRLSEASLIQQYMMGTMLVNAFIVFAIM